MEPDVRIGEKMNPEAIKEMGKALALLKTLYAHVYTCEECMNKYEEIIMHMLKPDEKEEEQ